MTKILSIDQSFTGTGIAILKDEKLILSTSIIPKKDITPRQIDYIISELNNIVNNDHIDIIVREGFSYGSKNRGKVFELGALGYSIDREYISANLTSLP